MMDLRGAGYMIMIFASICGMFVGTGGLIGTYHYLASGVEPAALEEGLFAGIVPYLAFSTGITMAGALGLYLGYSERMPRIMWTHQG